jgi:hypothetical protein
MRSTISAKTSGMSINWGTRIIILYSGFILLIGTLVWKSTQTKFDLVSEDYYAQEVGYQKKLDARAATAELVEKPVISVTPEAILLFFPQSFSGKHISAELQLYNAANAALDKKLDKLEAKEGRITIKRKGLPAVLYTGKLSWECEGRTFYQEAPLNLSWK